MKPSLLSDLTNAQIDSLDKLAEKAFPIETLKKRTRGHNFRVNGRGFFYFCDALHEARKATWRTIRCITEIP